MNPPPATPRNGCLAWSAGCVVALFCGAFGLTLLVVIFYAEENWRGARAWELMAADLKARGEHLDPDYFVSPPIPDAENFGALPDFQEVDDFTTSSGKPHRTLAFSKSSNALLNDLLWSRESKGKSGALPYLGNWQRERSSDPSEVKKALADYLQKQKPDTFIPPNATSSDLFGLICPNLEKWRAANPTHPHCTFIRSDTQLPPWKFSFGFTSAQIGLSQLLAYDEKLALASDRPDIAMADFQVGWKLNSGVCQNAVIVEGLIAIAGVAIPLDVIDQGLAEHRWNNQQMTELDAELSRLDFLKQGQSCFQCEVARFAIPMSDYFTSHRSIWMRQNQQAKKLLGEDSYLSDLALLATYRLIPRGWIDQAKAASTGQLLDIARAFDSGRRVNPDQMKEVLKRPQDISVRWMTFVMGDSHSTEYLKSFAFIQVRLDETRIACRLERYRLAHGKYPEKLEELIPAYGADLPQDILNGESYHYQLKPDQTFMLYSVGWNQTDDHGDAGVACNKDSSDWIWTNYPSKK